MATEVLSVSARPLTFREMIGQETVTKGIEQQAAARLPKCWLLIGPSGSGKTTLAHIIAASVQKPKGKFGYPRKEIIENLEGYSVIEANASDMTGIDDMRQLVDLSKYTPHPPAEKRVIYLDEVHGLSKAAQNMLLIPTEKVPDHLVWIFSTSEPGKLVQALRRRFFTVQMESLNDESRKRLVLHLKKVSGTKKKVKPFLRYINSINAPASGIITQAFEQYIAGVDPKIAMIDGGQDDVIEIVRAALAGNVSECATKLKALDAEKARNLRMVMCSYMRAVITGRPSERLSNAIHMMAENVPFEDPPMIAEITARVLDIAAAK